MTTICNKTEQTIKHATKNGYSLNEAVCIAQYPYYVLEYLFDANQPEPTEQPVKIIESQINETNHSGTNGNIQKFKSITIIADTDSKTLDSGLSSDWMTLIDNQIYVPVDSSEVDYSAEYQGEDIPLKPIDAIYICANEKDSKEAYYMASELKKCIYKLFNVDVSNVPVINVDDEPTKTTVTEFEAVSSDS